MSPWIQERKVQGKHKGLLLFAKLFWRRSWITHHIQQLLFHPHFPLMRQKGYLTGKPWTINLDSFISRSQITTLPPASFHIRNQSRWRSSIGIPSSWCSLYIYWVQTGTRGSQGQRKYRLADVRNPPPLITANTKRGCRRLRQKDSVNFPRSQPACDWFSTQIFKRVLLSYL